MNFEKIGLDHPFFAPVWRRWVTVVFLGGWTLFELVAGATVWGALFGMLTVFCVYAFFGSDIDYTKYED